MSITKVGNAYVCYQSVDPKRVEAVQALLDGLDTFPDLRIGQLINNARTSCTETARNADEFYITDEMFAVMLKEFSKKMLRVTLAEGVDDV